MKAPPCALVNRASCSNCELLCAGMAGLQGRKGDNVQLSTSNAQRPMLKRCADGSGATCGRMGVWEYRREVGGFVWSKKCGRLGAKSWIGEGWRGFLAGAVGLFFAEGTK